MVFVEKMKSMKIYKQPCFLPTAEGNKKKDSAVILLTPSYESSKNLMNNSMFINKKRFESYFLDRDVSYYIGNKKLEEVDESFLYLEETKRSELKDSDFGIPEDRKFPLDTEEHVRSAIKLFGHAEESKKKSLAKRISRKASKYGIKIPDTTQCYKYLHETVLEDNPGIKNIIFDLGSVLVSEGSIEDIFHLLGGLVPVNTIKNIIQLAHNMWKTGEYENATYEEEVEYMKSIAFPEDRQFVDMVYKYIILSVKPFEYTEDLLRALKSIGYKLYYLSNWNQASFELLLENHTFDFLQLMDGGVVSWETGKYKPDPEFYNILLNKYNLNPDECIFFDDREENIQAANNIGMHGYIFDYTSTYKEIMNNLVQEAFQPAEEDDNLDFKFSVPDTDIIDIKFEMDEKEKRWNSIVLVEGVAPKTLRGRSECLVIRDDMIYLDETESGICSKGGIAEIMYDVPGGGWDPNEPHDICAIRETNEEAKIDVKDVQYIDNYLTIDKVRPEGCYCDGLFSKVYIGKYAGKYTGPVADVDRADIAVSGSWYPIDEVYDKLNPIHKKAIDIYFGREPELAEFESPVDEATIVLLEFDIGEAVKDIKLKIKKFLYNLINKIEHWVRKIKNSKTRTVLLNIIEKAKDLLNKNHELEDKSQLQNLMKKANELGEEFNESILVEKYIDQEYGDVKRTSIATDIEYQILNKHDIDILWKDPRVIDSKFGSFDNIREYFKDLGIDINDKSKWNKDFLEKVSLCSIASYFSKEYCYYLYDVALYVKGIPKEIKESVFIIENSIQKSELDDNFKKKSMSDINYEVIDFHSANAKKYIETDSYLSNLYNKNQLKDFNGEIIVDKDNNTVIGRVFIGTGKDEGYIGALRVYDKYKGYGFGDILIKDAINKYGGYDLNVFKDNEVALKMYKNYGFEVVNTDSSDGSYYMKLKSKLNESANSITLEDIKAFNKELNSWDYGVLVNGKVYTDANEIDWSKYKTIPISDIEKHHVGVCWDLVNYEYDWFTKNGIKPDAYMFVMQKSDNPDDIVTHTFIIFKMNGKQYWFESSWFGHQGVKEVKSYTDVVDELVKKYGDHDYSVFKYNPSGLDKNISNGDFFKKTTKNLVKNYEAVKEGTEFVLET